MTTDKQHIVCGTDFSAHASEAADVAAAIAKRLGDSLVLILKFHPKRSPVFFPFLSIPPMKIPRIIPEESQFKSMHRAAPLLFKKIRRVEANMFAFFIALLLQALLERELRKNLDERNAPPLKLYPEDRDAPHPTSSQLFKTFERLSTYAITDQGQTCEEYRDELNETHRAVLALLDMEESAFWS